jgi:hypothetical protein
MKVLGMEVPPAAAEREPVLDVPAIDMTEQSNTSATDVGSADVAKPSRRRQTGKQKPRRAATTKAATGKRTRDGSVGRETFAAVEALMKQGSSKTDAFKAVAEKTNRSTGTVATTYYRVTRSQAADRPRRGKASTPPRSHRRSAVPAAARSSTGTESHDIDRLASSLVQSVNALAAVVRAQSGEIAVLRRRLDGVRSILD